MKNRTALYSVLGASLFFIGVLLGLTLSAFFLWGEIEARLYSDLTGTESMKLTCPWMLSPSETGTVRAEIVNFTNQDARPVVTIEVSRAFSSSHPDQTFDLVHGEKKEAEWKISSADAIFGKLILINILQDQYRENPSRLGSCSVLLFGLFDLTGLQTFILIIAMSIACLVTGRILWFRFWKPQRNFLQIISLLGILTILALGSILPRWWGFTLIFEAISIMVLGIFLADFILLPQKENSA